MKINWKVRLTSTKFYATVVIPIVVVIASNVWNGIDATQLSDQLNTILSSVGSVVAMFGGVIDPTTPGVSDSEKALSNTPAKSKTQQIKDLQASNASLIKQVTTLNSLIGTNSQATVDTAKATTKEDAK